MIGFLRVIAALAGSLLLTSSMAAADFKVAITPPDTSGRRIAVLSLHSPGQVISGLGFDLLYDPAVIRDVSLQPADAVTSQDKTVAQYEVAPGTLRVVIIGTNAYPMLNGGVVKVSFTSTGEALVRVVNAVATDPGGDAVGLSPSVGSAEVGRSSRSTSKRQR